MRKHSFIVVSLAALAACSQAPKPVLCASTAPYAGPPPRTAPAALPTGMIDLTKPMPQTVAARLEARFREGLAFNKAPAGAIAIYSPDIGYWSSTHGIAPEASKRFALGSITKMITASVIFQLAVEKKLSLEDTIDRWFADLPNSHVITVDHLLSHTSGLKDVDAGVTTDVGRYFFWPSEEWKQWGRRNNLCPGARIEYSNQGYVLLARIAEQVDGASFADIVDRRVAKPLGLTTFGIVRPGGEDALVAPGENATSTWWNLQGKKQSASFLSTLVENPGGGAAFGETGDVLVFLNAWLTGRLFPLASRDLALSRMIPSAPDKSFGRGVMMWQVPDDAAPATWLGHTGGMPGANTIVIYDATRSAWLAAAFNIKAGSVEAFASEMLKTLSSGS